MRSLRTLLCGLAAVLIASCNNSGSPSSVVPQAGGRASAPMHHSFVLPASSGKRRAKDATGALVDGGFESGGYTNWQQCGTTGVNAYVGTWRPHTGSYSQKDGMVSSPEVNGYSGLCQQITVPSGGKVTFWLYQGTNETSTTYAFQEADLLDSSGSVVYNMYTSAATTGAWVQKTYDLSAYAGKTYWLYFGVYGDGNSSHYIYQYVDDVAWTTTATPSPTATPSATPAPTPTPAHTPTPAPTPTPSGGPTPIPTPSGQGSQSCGVSCGVQRWHIKTLDDAYVNTINWTPKSATVTQAGAWPVPSGYDQYNDTTRYAPYETQAYTIRAILVGWKIESDHDYHIVIADPANTSKTMIIEPPDPACTDACASGFQNYYTSVRQKLVSCFGQPPTSFTNFPSGITVDVTGVPLFDALHGQTGVAPNGVELHPLLTLNFVSGVNC